MNALPFRRAIATVMLLLGVHYAAADETADRRTSAGVRLFRAVLAADTDLAKKTVAPNQLLIVFVCVDDRRGAADLAQRFVQEIRGLSVVTEVTTDATFAGYAKRVPAGIFIAQPPGKQALASIIRYGIQNRVVVYSPFEGHVESGVLCGLSVEAQVRPFVNRATLAASQISLKPFFLEVAKVY